MNIHVITGQTATGKSEAAIKKALHLNSDIISADSRHIYSDLSIVTGKDVGDTEFVKVEEIHTWVVGYYLVDGVRVWGMDIVSLGETFSSYNYREYVSCIISNTIDTKSIPIVIGGSYFYIQHLFNEYDFEAPPNWELRESLEQSSVEDLAQQLQTLDPEMYGAMNESDQKNPHRLTRRIEIATHQKQQSQQNAGQELPLDLTATWEGLAYKSRDDLELAIRTRVKNRLEQGALEEISNLLTKGYTQNDPGLKTIGCKQIIAYLKKETTEQEMIELWVTAEIQYAKRQYTFMKKNQEINWTFI